MLTFYHIYPIYKKDDNINEEVYDHKIEKMDRSLAHFTYLIKSYDSYQQDII